MPTIATAWLLIVGIVASGATGCATTGDVEKLQSRIAELEKRDKELREKIQEPIARLEKLKKDLQKAEATLRKSGANLGLRMERVEGTLPKLRGDLDAVVFNMKRAQSDVSTIRQVLAEKLGVVSVLLPPDLPRDAKGMWKEAMVRKKAGDMLVARAIFETFEATFPKHKNAPVAVMEVAALLEKEGETDKAIKKYANMESRFKGNKLVPKAILRIAELSVKQGKCKRAKNIYAYLAASYKGTKEATEAAKRVKLVGKFCN